MSEAMIVRKGGGSGGSINLQEKTVSPSAIRQEVTPSEGYGGLSRVNVEAIPNQKEAATYTPGLTEQKIEAGQWLTGDQTIAPISPTKAAQVYTPTLEVQTIPAGQWLTGDQIIAAVSSAGDANLVAANIKKGVSIFNVAGSYEAAGLDTNSAILKVVTSTGCSVTVTNDNDYDVEQLDAEGFVRSGDANVTEHFFVIPTAAFGTFTVKSTHPTYGDNEKQNAVVIGNARQVYEVLCGGKNILLSPALGAQEGLDFNMISGSKRYDTDLKCYYFIRLGSSSLLSFFTQSYDLRLYDNVVLKGVFTGYDNNDYFYINLIDKDGIVRRYISYEPGTSGKNMEISIPVEDKAKSPYTLSCHSSDNYTAIFRLNEFYFE